MVKIFTLHTELYALHCMHSSILCTSFFCFYMRTGGGKMIVIVLNFLQTVDEFDLSLLWVYSCIFFFSCLLFLLLSRGLFPPSVFLSTFDSQSIQMQQVAQSLWEWSLDSSQMGNFQPLACSKHGALIPSRGILSLPDWISRERQTPGLLPTTTAQNGSRWELWLKGGYNSSKFPSKAGDV